MITLYQFPRIWDLPNASPFCMKVENFLRMAALPYDIKFVHDPRKSPKGKLPFIKMDGQLIADSELIIDNLKHKTNDLLDKNLSDEQKALSVLIDNTFCDRLYWFMLYTRWQDEQGWLQIKDAYFSHLTGFAKYIVPRILRKYMKKQLHAQGMGRHNHEDVLVMGNKTIDALAVILGSNKYFLGEELTSVDATAFAFLANFLWFPFQDPFSKRVQQHENIKAYCERMQCLLYPDIKMGGTSSR